MTGPQDDQFDDDDDAVVEELDRHYEALRTQVYDYIDENDVPDQIIAALLNDLALEIRKVAYVLDTEKPSVSGLKLELDRYKSDLDAAIRRHKKEAEEFIDGMREAMAEAQERLAEELEQLEDTDTDEDDDLDDDDDDEAADDTAAETETEPEADEPAGKRKPGKDKDKTKS
ncbi:hypothetical protein [Rhodoplanes roseus]|uniref:Uncharacterized protein n=1 Tax=Rhodoplanes roseus TaxID=29409 RepID=A0A327KYF3_9BRAD|nr:hypothetical protein [Rhodoplanes roseus]RAI43879.1 hypothetical protein CH341_11955 [Rhodoplanes roseus]